MPYSSMTCYMAEDTNTARKHREKRQTTAKRFSVYSYKKSPIKYHIQYLHDFLVISPLLMKVDFRGCKQKATNNKSSGALVKYKSYQYSSLVTERQTHNIKVRNYYQCISYMNIFKTQCQAHHNAQGQEYSP